MYENYYKPLPDVDAYLERIGMKRPSVPDLDYLNKLIFNHLCHVPFENLDMYLYKKEVSLSTDALFDKIVLKKRGGYCFEMNSLFYSLLVALGYEVTPCLCKVIAGPGPYYLSSHRGSIVKLDSKYYYCDVGLGGPAPAGAFLFEEDLPQTICGDTFRLVRYSDTWLDLLRADPSGQEEVLLRINPTPYDSLDFVPINYFTCSQHASENDFFRVNLLMNMRKENGFAMIMNDMMREVYDGQLTVTDVSDPAVLNKALHEVFMLPDSVHF